MGEIDLLALAERVGKLSGPCRETDVEIARAVRWLPERVNPIAWEGRNYELAPSYWFKDGFGLPRYSASIDAAMTLVPKGADWITDNFDGPVGRRCSAAINFMGSWFDHHAATPALALCAAALRARASITRTTGDGDGNGLR